jgi:hypothetical protein
MMLLLTMCRPLVVEEYGLTKRYFDTEQIKVVVAVVADALIASRREGSPLMGAWIWQAAPIGTSPGWGRPT